MNKYFDYYNEEMQEWRTAGEYYGVYFDVDFDNENEVEELRKQLEEATHVEWGVFVEGEGKWHTVLYRTDMFYPAHNNSIPFRKDGEKSFLYFSGELNFAELPINASSCFGMFNSIDFPEDFKFKIWDTSQIEDMSFMFSESVLYAGQLDWLDTCSVKEMNYMFRNCDFRGAKFPDSFSAPSCYTAKGMFSGAKNLENTNALALIFMVRDCIS